MACVASVSMRIGSKESKTTQKMECVKEQRGGWGGKEGKGSRQTLQLDFKNH